MSEAWRADLKDSVKDFREQVAPVLEDWTDGRNVSVEAVTDQEMANELDQTAGVDSWNVKHDDIVRGVASRVQYLGSLPYDTPPDTFTIRKERQSGVKTEFQKRLYAIRKDGLYPHWTVQAYVDEPGGELLSVGRVRTKDLIEHVQDGSEEDGDYWVVEPQHEASFYAISWYRLKDIGVGVRTQKPYETEKPVKAKADKKQSGLSDFATEGGGS
jgi:hypothetical protein